ncbi:MAG: Nif3-like dinuclear metal center hexameric protein [Desulfobacteraceae bacterium]|nr:Nif3-like dinuclear metal center hexameric protein [Desulfobacteraceae bacterium]
MKTPKLSDILGIINKIAPAGLAEPWDNAGLQVGDPTAEITRIMVALDATPAVIESALQASCQLLVSHHPMIFKPQKSVSTATTPGKSIHAAIRGGLAVASMHTNYDIACGGLNDLLSERLGLKACAPLQVTATQELAKLVVFVPQEHLDRVRAALFSHAESLGSYRDCSFSAMGEGTFTPLDGARPFIGAVGTLEKVPEYRLEVLLDRAKLPQALKSLVSAHPYEEPAYDIYPLHNRGTENGLGRIGSLPEATTLADYTRQVAAQLGAPGTRFVGDPATRIQKVALCSGSGTSVMHSAVRAGAHVLVTGDVKYHQAREAEDLGIALIDAGHFHTEIIMAEAVAARLRRILPDSGFDGCQVMVCKVETDPFRYLH